jgi:hypothetical protein
MIPHFRVCHSSFSELPGPATTRPSTRGRLDYAGLFSLPTVLPLLVKVSNNRWFPKPLVSKGREGSSSSPGTNPVKN